MKVIVALGLLGVIHAINIIGRTQSVAVNGKLMCDGKPVSGAKVKLMESDNSFLPGVLDTDDVMGETKTDSQGRFSVSGDNKEITGIEPYLAIYHDCNDGLKPGSRIVRINIPSKYVSSGSRPKNTYEAGSLELAGKFPGEKRSGLFGRK